MRKLSILLFLAFTVVSTMVGQTVIELRRGGASVRAKSQADYGRQLRTPEQLREDSLQYIDCLTRGYNHLHADSLPAARQCFERALRLRPEAPANHVVHRELGKIAMAEGKYAESIEHFDYTLQHNPLDQDARFQRATCHIELRHPQQALDDCQTLFLHATDTATAVRILFLQSAAHSQLRQYPQVGDDLTQILRMNPLNAGAQILYAVNLESLGQPQEAINRLNLYLSAHPTDVEALSARANMHLRQRHPYLAREDADFIVEISPSPSAYLLRAKILDEIGEKRLAEADRKRARGARGQALEKQK